MNEWPEQQPYFLQFDGSCKLNPGPMGIGYLIRMPGEAPLIQVGAMVGEGTNNIAEYHALIAGLRHAIRFGVWNLRVESDSMLVVKQIDGIWKVRDSFLRKLHGEAKQLTAIIKPFYIHHISRTENTEADTLSREPAWIEPALPPTPLARNKVPLLLHPWQAAFIKHWWMRGLRNSYFFARIFGVSSSLIEHIGEFAGYRDADFSEMPDWTRVKTQRASVVAYRGAEGGD